MVPGNTPCIVPFKWWTFSPVWVWTLNMDVLGKKHWKTDIYLQILEFWDNIVTTKIWITGPSRCFLPSSPPSVLLGAALASPGPALFSSRLSKTTSKKEYRMSTECVSRLECQPCAGAAAITQVPPAKTQPIVNSAFLRDSLPMLVPILENGSQHVGNTNEGFTYKYQGESASSHM